MTSSKIISRLLAAVCVSLLLAGATSAAAQDFDDDPRVPNPFFVTGADGRVLTGFSPLWSASGKRTLVAAGHPAVVFQSRWLRPPPVAEYLVWEPEPGPRFNFSAYLSGWKWRDFAATNYWCSPLLSLSFTGSATLSVHIAPGLAGSMPTKLKWYIAEVHRPRQGSWKAGIIPRGWKPDFVLEKQLDPSKRYQITLSPDFHCYENDGFRFLGFGLDKNGAVISKTTTSKRSTSTSAVTSETTTSHGGRRSSTTRQSAASTILSSTRVTASVRRNRRRAQRVLVTPRALTPAFQPTLEFIGDSITHFRLFDSASPSALGSYGMEACYVLRTRCSILARGGMELIDYPPPEMSKLYGGAVGMSYGYFRQHAARDLVQRFPESPRWNFSAQGFTPRAVLINLGTNDCRQHIKPVNELLAQFESDYLSLISGIRKAYGNETTIIVLTPFGRRFVLPEGGYGFDLIWPVSVYAAIVEQANDPRVKLLDSTGWLNLENSGKYMIDNVHPNYEGLRYLGKLVAEGLKKMRVF